MNQILLAYEKEQLKNMTITEIGNREQHRKSKTTETDNKKQSENKRTIEVGSTVQVNYRIIEGNKERVQPFQGVVIARHCGDRNPKATFTVRRVNQGYGVERVFQLHSPRIESIQVLRKSVVRRAKLYFLRERVGRAARLREKIEKKIERK